MSEWMNVLSGWERRGGGQCGEVRGELCDIWQRWEQKSCDGARQTTAAGEDQPVEGRVWFTYLFFCYLHLYCMLVITDTASCMCCYFLRQLMHVDLHWLDVPEWVKFKLVSMVHNYLYYKAPWYLTNYCIPISDVASRRHLRSAMRHYLVVPWHSLRSYGCWAFVVADSIAWNSLSNDLRDPTLTTDSFRRLFKTRLFLEY